MKLKITPPHHSSPKSSKWKPAACSKARIERPARVDPQESPDFTMKREQWGEQVSSPPAHQCWISVQKIKKKNGGGQTVPSS